jgi:hypothetical protein
LSKRSTAGGIAQLTGYGRQFRRSDLGETVDDVYNHLLASVDDSEAEANEMSRPAQNRINSWRGGDKSARIEPKSKARTLRSKMGACYQALSGILVTLIAVLLVSLLFLFQSVTSSFSRK